MEFSKIFSFATKRVDEKSMSQSTQMTEISAILGDPWRQRWNVLSNIAKKDTIYRTKLAQCLCHCTQ